MGYLPYVEPFVSKAFQEDLNTIVNLPIFINPLVAFVMFLFCYAQRPNYLQHTIFPSPSISHCYIEFDVCTITMLENYKVKIFWHHSGPFDSLLGHFYYFSKGVKPPLNGLMCCPCFFKMLSFDNSYIFFLFSTR
jgi:hypothetical protein